MGRKTAEELLELCGWKPSNGRYGVWAVAYGKPQKVPVANRYPGYLHSWDDHGRLYYRSEDGCYIYITEPYPLGAETMQGLLNFCAEHDLHCEIGAATSIHNPGGCVHIRIMPAGKCFNIEHERWRQRRQQRAAP